MNLYRATLNRIHLDQGMMEMTVLVHAGNVQSAGRLVKKLWPAWVQHGKFQPIRKPIAINIGLATI